MRVQVSEWFISVQGEGPAIGQPALFLRLAGCNLACVWCDTPYSWDWSRFDRNDQVHSLSVDEMVGKLLAILPSQVELFVVTGGEPMLQQSGVAEIMNLLGRSRSDLRLEIETNGSVGPKPEIVTAATRFVVSPKLTNAGEPNRVSTAAVAKYSALNSVLKFVVRDEADVREASLFAEAAGFEPTRVWVMPEGVEAGILAERARRIVPAAIELGFSVSPRMHVDIWGDERGR